MRLQVRNWLTATIIAALGFQHPAIATTIYVAASANGANNGQSWGDAFKLLQNAIAIANPGDEIWVAAGTYKPAGLFGDQNATFLLESGVELYGGFPAGGGAFEDRDPSVHLSILSGDLNGNDGPNFTNYSENSFHVVTASGVDGTSVLDGVVVRNGYGGLGGGLFASGGSPTIHECMFTLNDAWGSGGGMFFNNGSHPSIDNCSFVKNRSTNAGGALYLTFNCNALVTNCTFTLNVSQGGASIFNGDNCNGSFTDCEFLSNSGPSPSQGGGAGVLNSFNSATFQYCEFKSNAVGGVGAGMSLTGTGTPTIRDCTFESNTGDLGAAMSISQTNAVVINCFFRENEAIREAGAIRIQNHANPTFLGCTIQSNASGERSGAILIDNQCSPVFTNCLIAHNSAVFHGGAIRILGCPSLTLNNCTVYGNQAGTVGGGIHSENTPNLRMRNTIIWGNTATSGSILEQQVLATGPLPQASSACIQGLGGTNWGPNNISDDPFFSDPDGQDNIAGNEDDELWLVNNSPCVDTGDNGLIPADASDLDGDSNLAEPVPFDIDGNDRVYNLFVDRGPYELGEKPLPPGTFVGPEGGSWFTASNWAGGTIPNNQSVVFIATTVNIDQNGAVADDIWVLRSGTLVIDSGSLSAEKLNIQTGGALALQDAAAVLNAQAIDCETGSSIVWNAGTVNLAGPWTSAIAVDMGCDGSAWLNLEAGSSFTGPALTVCESGEVAGHGIVNAELTNSGALKPGLAPATISVSGNYMQSAQGAIEISVPSYGPYDHVSIPVDGNVTLAGSLELDVLDSSNPAPRVFGVLSADSLSGAFDTTVLPPQAGEFTSSIVQDATTVSVAVQSTIPLGSRIYVNASGSPLGTGTSWANATTDLQHALNSAEASKGTVEEIWIAQGTYIPTELADINEPRSATFTLLNGVALYGGFAGDEINLSERNITANVTVLSGDRNGNDGADFANFGDNVLHVITSTDVDASAILDGVTIRGGNANLNASITTNSGGGIHNDGGAPTLNLCTFVQNRCLGNGGAIYNKSGLMTVQSCAFIDNYSNNRGGGIFNDFQGNAVISDCVFEDNFGYIGGGISNLNISEPTIVGCQFIANVTDNQGGALSNEGGSRAIIRDCTFDSNVSSIEGGAIYSIAADIVVVDSIFIGNFIGIRGGALYNEANIARFVNCSFLGNSSASRGGASLNRSGSMCTFVNCAFSGNYANRSGGAVQNESASSTLVNCTVVYNEAELEEGGGVAQVNNGDMIVDNCILWGNTHLEGTPGEAAQILNSGGSIALNHSCVEGLSGILGGSGNIESDPRFVDANGEDDIQGTLDDDLNLFFGSPAIDAGNNAALPADVDDLDEDDDVAELAPLDLASQLRREDDPVTSDTGSGSGAIVDMGALEFTPVCPGCPGDRLWVNGAGGSFDNQVNWFPDLPQPQHGVVFDLESSYVVAFDRSVANDHVIVARGEVTFDLNGHAYNLAGQDNHDVSVGWTSNSAGSLQVSEGTLSAARIRLGGNPQSFGLLNISANATVSASEFLEIGGAGGGSLNLFGGSIDAAGSGVVAASNGQISGTGAIIGDVHCGGQFVPGSQGIGTLTIDGDYVQLDQALRPSAGTMYIDLAGDAPGTQHDQVIIQGSATLAGSLAVSLAAGYTPTLGDEFTILTADSLIGEFEIVSLPALPTPLLMVIEFDDGAVSGQPAVVLKVDTLGITVFAFDDPIVVGGFNAPHAVQLIDLDNDDDLDAVLAVPDVNDNIPGKLLIFENLGLGPGGAWNGFAATPVINTVGREPRSLAAGHFNNDSYIDIAVTNWIEGKVLILLNNSGNLTFSLNQTFTVVAGAESVAAARFYQQTLDDLVVITSDENRQKFYKNNGLGIFTLIDTVNGGIGAMRAYAADLENDDDPELVCANYGFSLGEQGSVNVTFRDEQSNQFTSGVNYPTAEGTSNLEIGDVDASEFADVIAVNEVSDSATLLLNASDGTGGLIGSGTIPVGGQPTSLELVDLDDDGDLDMAIAAEDFDGQRVIRLKRNGLNGGDRLTFTDASSLLTGGATRFVLTGDVNGDSVPDLFAVNVNPPALAGGPATGSLSILINQTYEPIICPADIAPSGGDGIVNVDDLLLIINSWGPGSGPADIAPLGGNDIVDVDDLLAVITGWGTCE